MTKLWRIFDDDQIQTLGREAQNAAGSGERACPACGRVKIRTYRYFSERISGPTLITYVWCGHCHRYAGSTGPRPPGINLRDPLTPEDHQKLDHNLISLLEHLDHLWDIGRLPQTILSQRKGQQ